jgi:PST family polysaccharide transporter
MNARLAAQPVGLGTHSARGLVYLFAGASASKVVSFGAQIALTYLLSKSDFGVVSLAYTITSLIQVIEQSGVSDVLLRRNRFRVWAVPSFWLALAFGIVSLLLIVIVSPVAAAIYGNQQLVPILLILAPSSLANALMAVPRAQLGRDLRFRFLAALNFISSTLRMVLTVAFAAVGFGPYSFVLPVPLTAFAVAAFMWWWVRPVWLPRLRIRRWRYLIGDSTRLFTAEFGRAVLDQSDYMMLGLFRNVSIVGIYTVGFNFSIQMMQLLTVNLTNILFPALTKLNDQPRNQYQGFIKAQRMLAMVGISSCLLQAATAAPLTYLILDPKWFESVGVMQILSAGMALRMVAGSSYALLKSQGRFRAILWNRWGFVALQVLGLALVLRLGGGINSVAAVVAVVSTIIGPVTFYTAILPYNAGWRDVAAVLYRPALCALISIGVAWWIALRMEAYGWGYLSQLIETVLVAVSLNALLARFWMRPVWDDLWARVWNLVPRRAGR